ncbi:MAG TPA: 30S ribosomal protein S1 [Smithellaceae bacterium]|nr:MAG: 30S ribosomal protein S1 [Deltaproteobacteria bacterium ADurb.BinA014]HNV63824.1 30S ribosomal protein S1 [Smithellaceae bacterium]HNZ30681.1 30S ribosomal protein S1 [Smithellaceae bacterium]HOF77769.1 30S ribosomal protein S1 [Smithellaceae bacterium]HOM69934.1 30S ribosomal protein S1 [Smithellaceae bacterium]
MVNNNNLNLTKKKEVDAKFSDKDLEAHSFQVKEENMGFKELYEQSLNQIQYGNIAQGKVVQITNDMVMVDVGWKTEGFIPASELKDTQGNINVSVGDEIEVFIDKRDADGNLILSKNKATKLKVWDEIKSACENNTPVKGKVVEKVKGGLSVDIGIIAFLPGSQVDVRPVKDLDQFVGQTMDFKVLKYDRKRNNVVLSRRSIVALERETEKKDILESIQEGSIVQGVIKNITDYGIFIDLGGIDGLLHVTDISWGRITKPSDHFRKGDKITVKVLSFDREKERVSLGFKQLTENPWEHIMEKYPVGSIAEGKVVNLTDYGVFVELETGVEGLVHISEMYWTREIKHPSKVLKVGDEIKVVVLDVNTEAKRISLSLKQTSPNPWEKLKEKYPEGTIVKGVVRNITNFGVFVGIEEGIDGLIHVSDISWKHRVSHPSEYFKKGQEVEAVVEKVDVENEKFSLSVKKMEKNPWEALSQKYAPGSVVNGKITNFTDFGIFVEIEEGIEGLVHISEISQKRVKTSSELYAMGDTVSAVIKSIDPKSKKIRLSIKDAEAPAPSSSNHYLNNKENLGSNLAQALAEVKINQSKGD